MNSDTRSAGIGIMVALATVLVSSYFNNYITRGEYHEFKIEYTKHTTEVVGELKMINKSLNDFVEHLKETH